MSFFSTWSSPPKVNAWTLEQLTSTQEEGTSVVLGFQLADPQQETSASLLWNLCADKAEVIDCFIPTKGSPKTFSNCECVRKRPECVLGDASGCGHSPSGGLFLAGPARHRHEAEDQGPPDERGKRATRCVFTWAKDEEIILLVCSLCLYILKGFLFGKWHDAVDLGPYELGLQPWHVW